MQAHDVRKQSISNLCTFQLVAQKVFGHFHDFLSSRRTKGNVMFDLVVTYTYTGLQLAYKALQLLPHVARTVDMPWLQRGLLVLSPAPDGSCTQ